MNLIELGIVIEAILTDVKRPRIVGDALEKPRAQVGKALIVGQTPVTIGHRNAAK